MADKHTKLADFVTREPVQVQSLPQNFFISIGQKLMILNQNIYPRNNPPPPHTLLRKGGCVFLIDVV